MYILNKLSLSPFVLVKVWYICKEFNIIIKWYIINSEVNYGFNIEISVYFNSIFDLKSMKINKNIEILFISLPPRKKKLLLILKI